jgi:RNA polymerase sigma-70 factor (ECF subfamily)
MDRLALPMASGPPWPAPLWAEFLKVRTVARSDAELPSELLVTGRRPADPRIVAGVDAQHGQALLGFVRRLGLTDAQADDAVQDVMVRMWTELQRGTVIENPRAWAYRAIYRVAMDQHRLGRRIAALREVLGSPNRQTESRDPSDRIAVWSEVDRLPERQRQVVYLRYRSDLQFDEIGEVLGITSSAARSHSTQAMATLRSRFAQNGSER